MISLRHVSKRFKLYSSPTDRLMEWVLPVRRHKEFYALKDITLEVPRGRTVGIVGQNGAGKSTLLKIITGTLLPTDGELEIGGRVAALLELGTGFHPEFTGRQNIFINGQLLGMNHEELVGLEPEIIGFSELGPFIDQPVRTYSSGMILRLGFSIAAAMNPELLIIDEALSVGDARFSQKCIRRIREFRDQGTTILFVSHDPGAVTTLCDEAILLERGEVRSRGLPSEILDEYRALLAEKGAGNVAMRITRVADRDRKKPRSHGTFQAVISEVEVRNAEGKETDLFHVGDELVLHARIDFLKAMSNPTMGFVIKDRLGQEIYGTNTTLQGISLGDFASGDFAELSIKIPVRFNYGDYSVTIAAHDDETHLEACYDWTDNAAIFSVRVSEKPTWTGIVELGADIQHRRGKSNPRSVEEVLIPRFGQVPDPLIPGVHRPCPFLSGFGPQEERNERPIRPIISGEQQRFLFQSSGNKLQLELSREGAAPITIQLLNPNLGVVGEVTWSEESGFASFDLPEELVGRLAVYDLILSGCDQPVVLYSIRSETKVAIHGSV